jgi:hypothetical protein
MTTILIGLFAWTLLPMVPFVIVSYRRRPTVG